MTLTKRPLLRAQISHDVVFRSDPNLNFAVTETDLYDHEPPHNDTYHLGFHTKHYNLDRIDNRVSGVSVMVGILLVAVVVRVVVVGVVIVRVVVVGVVVVRVVRFGVVVVGVVVMRVVMVGIVLVDGGC